MPASRMRNNSPSTRCRPPTTKRRFPAQGRSPNFPGHSTFSSDGLSKLKGLEAKDRTKARDLDKALALSRDIVNIRVKKIASLGASGEQTTEVTANLTVEEQALYEKVRENVESWKKDILGRESSS